MWLNSTFPSSPSTVPMLSTVHGVCWPYPEGVQTILRSMDGLALRSLQKTKGQRAAVSSVSSARWYQPLGLLWAWLFGMGVFYWVGMSRSLCPRHFPQPGISGGAGEVWAAEGMACPQALLQLTSFR